jgi:hypothetical protein
VPDLICCYEEVDPVLPIFDRKRRRRIRLLEALQGIQYGGALSLDPDLPIDLAKEAADAARHFYDVILNPDPFLDVPLREFSSPPGVAEPPVVEGPAADFSLDDAALLAAPAPVDGASKGTVLIVPGGMASSLYDYAPHPPRHLWINTVALSTGRFYDLPLGEYRGPNYELDLKDPTVKIKPVGPIAQLYQYLSLALSLDGWTTRFFPYDWRKDMDNCRVAQRLMEVIKSGGSREPLHIITHSQGGMVARKALSDLASEMKCDEAKKRVGRIIMLGPANYGAFVTALAVGGDVKQIPISSMFPEPHGPVQGVLASFTALYQLMPWDTDRTQSYQDGFDIRTPAFWAGLDPGLIDGNRLERSFPTGAGTSWAGGIDTTCYNKQITVILGSHPFRKTPGGVRIVQGALRIHPRYGLPGDGWVPDIFAKLDDTTAYRATNVGHIRLPMAPKVILAIVDILDGKDPKLPGADG